MTAFPTPARATIPKLPDLRIIPNAQKQAHLSYSQVRSYATCSLKWWFSRRYEPEFVPAALVFGKAWHAAVERYYQLHLEGHPHTMTTLLEAFFTEYRKEAKPIQYGKTDAAPAEEQIAAMLQAFLAVAAPGKVIAIEQEVRCSLGDDLPELLGYIDLVEALPEPKGGYALHLVDFKSCARDPGDSLDGDQLLLYAWAVRQTGLLAEFQLPLRLRFDYITKTKVPQAGCVPVEIQESAIQRILAKIRQCWRGMRQEIVYPCPGWQCAGCGYKTRCGRWPKELAGVRSPGGIVP